MLRLRRLGKQEALGTTMIKHRKILMIVSTLNIFDLSWPSDFLQEHRSAVQLIIMPLVLTQVWQLECTLCLDDESVSQNEYVRVHLS